MLWLENPIAYWTAYWTAYVICGYCYCPYVLPRLRQQPGPGPGPLGWLAWFKMLLAWGGRGGNFMYLRHNSPFMTAEIILHVCIHTNSSMRVFWQGWDRHI